MTDRCDVAVIGGGLAGAAAARLVHQRGLSVVVVDKGRAAGGRLATMRRPHGAWDYGAQYFTARDPRVMAQVEAWHARGVVAEWHPRRARPTETPQESWWVGVPSMRALALDLLEGIDTRIATRVARLTRARELWTVHAADGSTVAQAEHVVVTAPIPQAKAMLPELPELEPLSSAHYAPCWALRFRLVGVDTGVDVYQSDTSPIAWLAANASKPGRAADATWVAHASVDWSNDNLERDADAVVLELTAAASRLLGVPVARLVDASAHRWRFARPVRAFDAPLHLSARNLTITGDAFAGPRVGSAFVSGCAAAELVVADT